MNKSELIAAMDAHDTEGERLQKAATELGLDAKAIKAIRKAEAASAKARATLAELMGEPVKTETPPTETTATEPETTPETTDETTTDETETPTEGAQKKGGK